MAARITSLIPTARTLSVGGREFQVREARLADLAALQAWVDSKTTDPLDSIWDRLNDPALTDPERDRLLFDAIDSGGDGPPEYCSAEGRRLLATEEGIGVFLFLALGRGSRLSAEELAETVAAMTGREFAAVRRAFYGVEPAREIERMLTDTIPQGPPGHSVSWHEAIDEVARSHHWTYEYCYSLTLSEFRNARSGGKPPEDGIPITGCTPEEAMRILQVRRSRAYGIEPDPVVSGGPGEGTSGECTPGNHAPDLP